MVHVDRTGPQVSVLGLQDRHGLYVYNATDLSTVTLAVNVSDEHSGIYTIEVALGTTYLSDDVAHRSVRVQRLDTVVSGFTVADLLIYRAYTIGLGGLPKNTTKFTRLFFVFVFVCLLWFLCVFCLLCVFSVNFEENPL